ncbi:MAG: SDR family oxidoreductase [Myxococcales bacterium]|nr:SDR family oxidoreductase [Myxococcales bacterium]
MKCTDWFIDADTHITEPGDVWTSRLPQKFQDAAPRMIRTDDGVDLWQFGRSERKIPVGATAAAVAILDRDQEACDAAVGTSQRRHGFPVDLRDPEAIRAVVRRVETHFDRLDAVVHCAAYVGTTGVPGWAGEGVATAVTAGAAIAGAESDSVARARSAASSPAC